MDIEQIVAVVAGNDGILVLRPGPGDQTPEIAWGDVFVYFSPDGTVPPGQPFATVITKDYPYEPAWQREAGSIRVNIHVGAQVFTDLLGHPPGEGSGPEPTAVDVVMPHPAYGELGWISVVDPGERTARLVAEQLQAAYAAARRRHERRQG
ncbi:MAG TPA: hypothetical protein H9815_12415 [Candidatus Ruania gallistercoris]|uniref:DUF6194 domain-containing protein n=1 Tax=Candidatus Ruania gallistercoris TaxID=2838746 RepID=A0A9D2EF82_9MICO|nr:hypothetical protein [Candidatus Ruania gallistercoris]